MTMPTFTLARIRITVWRPGGVFLAALALGAALLMRRMRQADLADSEAQVVHFVAGAEAALNRVLLGFDVLLASTPTKCSACIGPGRPPRGRGRRQPGAAPPPLVGDLMVRS